MKGSYPGKERPGRSNSECSGSEVVFLVNVRFQVEVRSSTVCDLPLFYKLIDSMNRPACRRAKRENFNEKDLTAPAYTMRKGRGLCQDYQTAGGKQTG